MQKCNIIVRLGGSLSNTVHKTGVTPAEILVLQHIHGEDGVVDIRPTDFDKRLRNEDVLAHLRKQYEPHTGGFASQPAEEEKSVIGRLFPGAMPKLPTTLSEIGMADIDPQAEGQPEPTKRTRKAKPEPAPVVEPEPETEEGSEDGDVSEDEPTEEATGGLNWGATGDGGEGEEGNA